MYSVVTLNNGSFTFYQTDLRSIEEGYKWITDHTERFVGEEAYVMATSNLLVLSNHQLSTITVHSGCFDGTPPDYTAFDQALRDSSEHL